MAHLELLLEEQRDKEAQKLIEACIAGLYALTHKSYLTEAIWLEWSKCIAVS